MVHFLKIISVQFSKFMGSFPFSPDLYSLSLELSGFNDGAPGCKWERYSRFLQINPTDSFIEKTDRIETDQNLENDNIYIYLYIFYKKIMIRYQH